MRANPRLATGSGKTWEVVKDGIVKKVTLTHNADGSYSFELDIGAASVNPSFVKVVAGTLTTGTDPTSKITTTTASFTDDFDALQSVQPSNGPSGQITATSTLVGDPSKPAPGMKRTLTITFTNLMLRQGDPTGPRTGSLTQVIEPSIGGDNVYLDSHVLQCAANPSHLVSDTESVQRWYTASDTHVHGRADDKATGGIVPASDTYLDVICRAGTAGYTMRKLEDGSGNTLMGSASPGGVCDPVFGSVPSLTNNATDYTFSASVSFPNEW